MKEAPELNVLDSVIGLTSARAKSLCREELQAIGNSYYGGLQAHSVLEATTGSELIRIVRGDIETAVSKLVGQEARYGESRYASLQAAEKMVKAAIELEGKRYEFGHELKPQFDHLATLGIIVNQSQYVQHIKCGSEVRYGKEPSSEMQAFAAHQATLALVLELVHYGAKFSTDLKWWMHPESTFKPN